MTLPGNDNQETAVPRALSFIPGGAQPGATEIALAALIVGAMLTLWGIRRGVRGLGPVELAGSTLSGVEFAAYLMVVGSIIRLASVQWADRPIGKALSFIY